MAKINIKASDAYIAIAVVAASEEQQKLKKMTPDEITCFIDRDIKGQKDIKDLLKLLTQAVVALSHQIS